MCLFDVFYYSHLLHAELSSARLETFADLYLLLTIIHKHTLPAVSRMFAGGITNNKQLSFAEV